MIYKVKIFFLDDIKGIKVVRELLIQVEHDFTEGKDERLMWWGSTYRIASSSTRRYK